MDEMQMMIGRLPMPEEDGSISTTYYSMRYSMILQESVYAFVISPNNGEPASQ